MKFLTFFGFCGFLTFLPTGRLEKLSQAENEERVTLCGRDDGNNNPWFGRMGLKNQADPEHGVYPILISPRHAIVSYHLYKLCSTPQHTADNCRNSTVTTTLTQKELYARISGKKVSMDGAQLTLIGCENQNQGITIIEFSTSPNINYACLSTHHAQEQHVLFSRANGYRENVTMEKNATDPHKVFFNTQFIQFPEYEIYHPIMGKESGKWGVMAFNFDTKKGEDNRLMLVADLIEPYLGKICEHTGICGDETSSPLPEIPKPPPSTDPPIVLNFTAPTFKISNSSSSKEPPEIEWSKRKPDLVLYLGNSPGYGSLWITVLFSLFI